MKRLVRRALCVLLALCTTCFFPGAAPEAQAATKYLSLMRVVTAWEPYTAISWERAAPIKATSNFQYFEATIYPDAVHLYRFDNQFDPDQSFPNSAAWVRYRESYRIGRVPVATNLDAAARSRALREAFRVLLVQMVRVSPSLHYGLLYSGHGSADGGLFARAIAPPDAQNLFESLIALLGRRLDFLDLGSNCSEGTIDMASYLSPYFDFIIASDLLVGGYTMDDWTLEKYNATDPEYQYPLIMTPARSLRENLVRRVDLARQRWQYSRANMTAQKVRQSISLFQSSAFDRLASQLRQELAANPADLSLHDYDVYSYAKAKGSAELRSRFLAFRSVFRSNKDFFPWTEDKNGLAIYSTASVAADFAVYSPAPPRTVLPGGTARVPLTIRRRNGFAAPVTLAVAQVPVTLQASLSAVTGTNPGRASLTVVTGADTPLGPKTIAVKALGGGLVRWVRPVVRVVE